MSVIMLAAERLRESEKLSQHVDEMRLLAPGDDVGLAVGHRLDGGGEAGGAGPEPDGEALAMTSFKARVLRIMEGRS